MSGLELDYRERDGFMTGRSAAIAEWRHRKECASFEKLVRRLYARKWAAEERARHPEKVNARLRRWRAENHQRYREHERAYRARRRVRPVLTCEVCGAKHFKTFRTAKYCGATCRMRALSRRRSLDGRRNRGIRNMRISEQTFGVLSAEPGLTLRQLADRLVPSGVKFGSLATLLSTSKKAGKLRAERKPGSRATRYFVAGGGS